jgi:hypothetical protein
VGPGASLPVQRPGQTGSSSLPPSGNRGGLLLNVSAQNDGQMTVRRSWKVDAMVEKPCLTWSLEWSYGDSNPGSLTGK